MNSTVKTILIWILILGAAVALYNVVERGTGGSTTPLPLTEFIQKLDADEVADVTINGSNVRGHLKAKPLEEFTSVIPPEYDAIYDKVTSKAGKVTIIAPDANPWLAMLLSWGLPMLFVFGFWILNPAIMQRDYEQE